MYFSTYALIVAFIALYLGIMSFIAADSQTGRIFIVAAVVLLFFLPKIWHSRSASFVSFIGWLVFGLGCYIYLKWRGEGPY